MPRIRDEVERFWSKADRSGGDDACWIWQAGQNGQGYGAVRFRGKPMSAHRAAWIITHGEIPDGLYVCHDCPDGDNPLCINPRHFFLGTCQENIRDAWNKGRHDRQAIVERSRPYRKLTEASVSEIRHRFSAGGVLQKELAREYGVSKATICTVLAGRTWREVAR